MAMENAGDEGLDSFKRADGVMFVRASTTYAAIVDREELMEAIEESGLEVDLTRVEVKKKELNEFARECLEEGKPFLRGMSSTVKQYISRRKG